MSAEDSQKGPGWYPGKFASKAMRRASTTGSSSSSSSTHDFHAAAAAASMSAGGTGGSSGANATSMRSKSEAMKRRSVLGGITGAGSYEKVNGKPVALLSSLPRNQGNMYAVPGESARVPIGNAHLQIFGLKYPTLTNPSIRVELDGDIRNYDDLTEFFEENLTIFDISSQIVITLIENYTVSNPEAVGQIILPMSAYVGMSKPLPSIREHRMFFPVRNGGTVTSVTKGSALSQCDQIGVLRGGFDGVTGSAMTKPRQALGFIDMKLEVSLTLDSNTMSSFYMRPPMALEYNSEAALIEVDEVRGEISQPEYYHYILSMTFLFLLDHRDIWRSVSTGTGSA
jgi:hypothetical protein